MTQIDPWTEILANPDGRAITAEITRRFLQLNTGTPLHEAKAQLGTKRGVLDELVRQQIIQIKGQWYFPCFLALESEAAHLRNRANTFTTVVLKALKKLYERTGKRDYSASEVLTMVGQTTQIDVSHHNVHAGMLLAADFPTFVNGLGFSADGAVSQIVILEGILDFDSIDSAWQKELARRRSIHQARSPVAASLQERSTLRELPNPGRGVFVIHGRDERLRKGMFDYLRAIGLDPREWPQLLTRTGEGSPYIGNVLDAAFKEAQAVVAMLTPDDLAKLRDDLIKADDPSDERTLTGQPRLNVVFEAGMAFASHPKQTVLVQIGKIRHISDLSGRHMVKMDNSVEKRQELALKLRAAGCTVNIDGTDWHTAGDLTQPITQAYEPTKKENQSRPLIRGDILEAYAATNCQTTVYDFETAVALRVRLVNESVRSSILDYELTVEGNKPESSNLRAGDLSYWRLAKEEKVSPKGTKWVRHRLVSLDAEIGNGVLETGIKKEGWLVFLMKNLEPEDIREAEIILLVEDAYKQKHRISRKGLSTDGQFVETAWGG